MVGTGCQVGDTVDDETNVVVVEEVGIEGITGISHYQVTHVVSFMMIVIVNVFLTLRKWFVGFGDLFLTLGKRLDACARVVMRILVGLVVTVEEAVGADGDHCFCLLFLCGRGK